MTRPHKEERFLFPVYPLLCFTAIFGMEMLKVRTYILVDGNFEILSYFKNLLPRVYSLKPGGGDLDGL